MLTKVRKILKDLVFVTLPTFLVIFLILELFFRFVIPASNHPGGYFHEDEKIYSHNNSGKEGIVTYGRFAELRSKWRINNMHWNYSVDYTAVEDKKLIAVIGDSYVEAFQVDVDKNYPYLLREKLSPEFEVYAFGKSGNPLSQYLHISRYVNKYFDPEVLIFNIIHNDFYESIYEFHADRHHCLQLSMSENDTVFTEMDPVPDLVTAQYNLWKRILYKSAVFRYLYLNLKVQFIYHNLRHPTDEYQANINIEEVKNNKEIITRATEYIISKIRNENKGKRIIFILDAPRMEIYEGELEKSKVLWINDIMAEACLANDVEFIDLKDVMYEDYLKNKKKFNSEIDAHWNEYGHSFVANYLYTYLKYQ